MTQLQKQKTSHISPALLSVMLKHMTIEQIVEGCEMDKQQRIDLDNGIYTYDPELTAYDME